jgi:hypothetical protein
VNWREANGRYLSPGGYQIFFETRGYALYLKSDGVHYGVLSRNIPTLSLAKSMAEDDAKKRIA